MESGRPGEPPPLQRTGEVPGPDSPSRRLIRSGRAGFTRFRTASTSIRTHSEKTMILRSGSSSSSRSLSSARVDMRAERTDLHRVAAAVRGGDPVVAEGVRAPVERLHIDDLGPAASLAAFDLRDGVETAISMSQHDVSVAAGSCSRHQPAAAPPKQATGAPLRGSRAIAPWSPPRGTSSGRRRQSTMCAPVAASRERAVEDREAGLRQCNAVPHRTVRRHLSCTTF